MDGLDEGDNVVGAAEGLVDGTLDSSIVGIFDGRREGLMVGVLVVGPGVLDLVVGIGLGDSVGLDVVSTLDDLEVVG